MGVWICKRTYKMHGVLPGDIVLVALRHLFWHTLIQEGPLLQHGYQIDVLLDDIWPLQPKSAKSV